MLVKVTENGHEYYGDSKSQTKKNHSTINHNCALIQLTFREIPVSGLSILFGSLPGLSLSVCNPCLVILPDFFLCYIAAVRVRGEILISLSDPDKQFLGLFRMITVSYTHLRAHETDSYLVCRLLLEKK